VGRVRAAVLLAAVDTRDAQAPLRAPAQRSGGRLPPLRCARLPPTLPGPVVPNPLPRAPPAGYGCSPQYKYIEQGGRGENQSTIFFFSEDTRSGGLAADGRRTPCGHYRPSDPRCLPLRPQRAHLSPPLRTPSHVRFLFCDSCQPRGLHVS
jgi:hypothetical protein